MYLGAGPRRAGWEQIEKKAACTMPYFLERALSLFPSSARRQRTGGVGTRGCLLGKVGSRRCVSPRTPKKTNKKLNSIMSWEGWCERVSSLPRGTEIKLPLGRDHFPLLSQRTTTNSPWSRVSPEGADKTKGSREGGQGLRGGPEGSWAKSRLESQGRNSGTAGIPVADAHGRPRQCGAQWFLKMAWERSRDGGKIRTVYTF